MPYGIRRGSGARRYKIVKKVGGGRTKVVGSSTSKAKAKSAVRVRNMVDHGVPVRRRRKRG